MCACWRSASAEPAFEAAEACLAFADKYGAALCRLEAGSLFAAAAAARNALVCSAAFAAGQLLRLIA